jgi:hypothetical protein
MSEPGGAGGPAEFLTQCVLGQALAVVGEQELSWPPGARVRDRPAWRAGGDDPVEQDEGFIV